MSHTNTRLELHPGLNVLIGPNNSGKSAVVLALQLLATLPNREGDYMVRHGEKECSVEVETAEGDTIIWERKGSSIRLHLNDEKLDRLSNNQEHNLGRLHELLRMPQVSSEGNNEKFDVHFALQKSPIFLLDSESGAATFFASSSDASRLMRMQGLFREKARAKKSERTHEKARQIQLQADLKSLEPLVQLEPSLEKLGQQHATLSQALLDAEKLELTIEQLDQATQRVSTCQKIASSLEKLQTPPDLVNVQPLAELNKNLSNTLHDQKIFDAEVKHLRPLLEPPVLEDAKPLQKLLHETSQTQKQEAVFLSQNDALKNLAEPPVQQETRALESLTAELSTTLKRLALAEKRQAIFENLQEAPSLQPLDELSLDVRKLESEINRITSLQKAAQDDEKEFEEWVSKHPNCPHCGSVIASVSGGGDHEH